MSQPVKLTEQERESRIQQYAKGPARLREALAGVPKEALQWKAAPNEFSIHEIVCHCADSETNDHMRIRYLVAEKEPVILGYDPDNWASRFDYHSHPLEVALATVGAVRANTATLLGRVPEDAWHKVGTHTEMGRYSAEDWLRECSEHLEEHFTQMNAVLEAWHKRS